MKTVWTPVLIKALQRLRADGLPLYLCAEMIGIDYKTANRQAQKLGIAGRLNRGRKPGPAVVAETRIAR